MFVASFKRRREAMGGVRDDHLWFWSMQSRPLNREARRCGFEAHPMNPLNEPSPLVHADSGSLTEGDDERRAALSRAGEARRRFLIETGVLTTGLAAAPYLGAAPQVQTRVEAPTGSASQAAGGMRVRLDVNGRDYDVVLDPRVTLLDTLRERLALTGTKKGCDRGQCGACTVLVNDRRINSCLSLAVSHQGDRIVTVEGLARGATLHPVQQAFLDHDAFQC